MQGRSSLALALVAAAAACTYTPQAPAERNYLDVIRAMVPGAASLSDEALLRAGYQLCPSIQSDQQAGAQRAVELVYAETGDFSISEFDLLTIASNVAPAMCDGSLSLPSPLPTPLAGASEAQSAAETLRHAFLDALTADLVTALGVSSPAVVERVSLRDGVLQIRIRPNAGSGDNGHDAAFAGAQLAATLQQGVANLGALWAALIIGAPGLTLELTVLGREQLFTRSDAGVLGQVGVGELDADQWWERTVQAP